MKSVVELDEWVEATVGSARSQSSDLLIDLAQTLCLLGIDGRRCVTAPGLAIPVTMRSSNV